MIVGQVSPQLISPIEVLLADWAKVPAFGLMCSLVLSQVRRLPKSRTTFFTLKWPLPCMGAIMHDYHSVSHRFSLGYLEVAVELTECAMLPELETTAWE